MRLPLALTVLVAIAGCGSPAAQEEELPKARAAFCQDAARVVRLVARTYSETTFDRSDLNDLRRLSDAIAVDATNFDSIPAVDTDIPNLAPAARRMRDSLGTVTDLLRTRGDYAETTVASGDVLDAVTAIPRRGCDGTELDRAATRKAMREAASKVRCFNAVRFLRTAERFGKDRPDESGRLVEESAYGFEVARRLFDQVGDRDAVPVLTELSKTLHSWTGTKRWVLHRLSGVDRIMDILTHDTLCE
jgi:hypothetical protein